VVDDPEKEWEVGSLIVQVADLDRAEAVALLRAGAERARTEIPGVKPATPWVASCYDEAADRIEKGS